MTTFENVKETMKEKRHRQDARLGHALAMDERARPGSRQSRQNVVCFCDSRISFPTVRGSLGGTTTLRSGVQVGSIRGPSGMCP